MSFARVGKWLVLWGWAALLLVMTGALCRAQEEAPGRETFRPSQSLEAKYVPGEVLVKFKESPATFRGRPCREHLRSVQGAGAAEFAAALPARALASLEGVQGRVVRAHPSIGLLRVKLPAQMPVGLAIDALYRSGTVAYAEPNALLIPQATPNDPRFVDQWALHNEGTTGTEGADIKAPEAWEIITGPQPGKASAIVAVIDTGVDYTHEDLTANMWVNTGEIPGNGIDDDDNHFVDDYYGIDTTVTPSSGNPMDPPYPTGGHGTAMAGVIGAVGNNSTGMTGVNWQTKIMALRCGNASGGTIDNAITCMNYALSQRAKMTPPPPMILVLGWKQAQDNYYNAMHDALRIAQDAGVLVVAAAGNNDEDNDVFPNYPSSYNHDPQDFPTVDSVTLDNVISVGASDQFDHKETNSSFGLATVDLFAPGKNIVITLPGNKYGSGTGSSYAAAHVAGAGALLWSKYPDKDWKQIKALILNGAEDGLAQDFRTICVTEGRLNLVNSLKANLEAPAVFSVFEVTPSPDDPAIVPGRADTGETLVITGVNFGTTPGTLSFLHTTFPAANLVSWDNEKIVATVPAGLPKGVGRLTVTSAKGLTSRGACFSNLSRERLVGNLILARGLAASAQVGRDVWIIGGRTFWGIVPQVEKFSLDTKHTVIDSKWMMPTPVSNAGAASIGSKIYVVGGLAEDSAAKETVMANLQIFDTATQTWDNGPPLPQPLMQCAVISLGNKLYAFGGLKPKGVSYSAVTDAYVFDPEANAWNGVAALPTATAYAAAAPTGSGKIWVMGGFSTSSQGSQQRIVQEYDPAMDQWTPQLHLVKPRGGAAGLNYGGKVYCLRGTNPPPTPFSPAVYDAYADGEWYNPAWSYWMPSIMNYLGIFVAPPSVFARKGLYTPAAGQYRDKIYLLGGVTGTVTTYKYDYSNKVWAFPAGGGGRVDITPILKLLLSP